MAFRKPTDGLQLKAIDESPDDPHHMRIKGRAWRRTDPTIPKSLLTPLTKELMSARRAVSTALKADDSEALRVARSRVNDAKIALGERGNPWWHGSTDAALRKRIAATIRALLRQRDAGKTICPSEAARSVASSRWRELMPTAVDVAWTLNEAGWLEVTQRGVSVQKPTKGPIRLRRRIQVE